MTEPIVAQPSAAPATADDKTLPIVIYVLYLLSLPSIGATLLIGFVMAYALKGGAGVFARSHYVFLIRTVWIALAWALLGGVILVLGLPLTLVLIGFVFLNVALAIFGLIGIWMFVRSVVGLVYAARREAYPRPRAWFI